MHLPSADESMPARDSVDSTEVTSGLTPSAIGTYQRDGILFPVAALSLSRAERLRESLEALEAQLSKTPAPMRWTNLCFGWAYDIAMDPVVLDRVEALLGPEIIVMGSNVFCKHPGHHAYVGWHQDSVNDGEDAAPAVSAWIAATDSTRANGCMRVIPGTHRERLEHRNVPDPANLLRGGRILADPVDERKAVDVELRAGEMSLHHDLIVHGSQPNCGGGKRIGFVIRYTTPAARSRGFPVVRARGSAACPQLELAGRPPDATPEAAFTSYLAFAEAREREIARKSPAAGSRGG
ncbi:phytanoyl-CoA dioxygenase family protein [Bradyrhizobium diazoefficiens]|nr:phytanoyl-CoA dioxygenase family protein [Bradyrhizobium diazoefficiens]MBR0848846.1 phytanoyl-CoA dioxygenase family protein [Bradyrhizobium diazoefficiens]